MMQLIASLGLAAIKKSVGLICQQEERRQRFSFQRNTGETDFKRSFGSSQPNSSLVIRGQKNTEDRCTSSENVQLLSYRALYLHRIRQEWSRRLAHIDVNKEMKKENFEWI